MDKKEKVEKFLESCTVELREFMAVYLLFVKKITATSDLSDLFSGFYITAENYSVKEEEVPLFSIASVLRYVAKNETSIKNLETDVPEGYSALLHEAMKDARNFSIEELAQLFMMDESPLFDVLINNIDLEKEGFSLKLLRNNLVAAYSEDSLKLTQYLKEMTFVESNDIAREVHNMNTKVSYEVYKEKALPDTKYILDAYFAAVVFLTRYFPNEIAIYKKDENRRLDDNETILFIFLFILYMFPNDIHGMWRDREIDVLANYDIPVTMVDIMKAFETNLSNIPEQLKKNYYDGHLLASAFIRKHLDTGKDKISIERIVANIFKKYGARYPHFMENFKLGEWMEELEGLADAKEKQDKVTIVFDGKDLGKTLEGAGLKMGDDVKQHLASIGQNEDSQKTLSYGTELTKKVYKYDPLLGREKELRKLGALLLDERKSVILKGAAGVGKTALVDGLAYRIQNGTINELLKDFRIFSFSATEMIASTPLRGQLEEKMLKLLHELMEFKNAILFIDEIHMVMGGGVGVLENPIDLSNMLKPYVGNGNVTIIGATTDEEYRVIARNGAFKRRFNTIPILPLKEEEIILLLNSLIKRYEQTKHIEFPLKEEERNALFHIIFELSDKKYQSEDLMYNPDLALTILDNAYDFAMYDKKQMLDLESLRDGLSAIESINEEGHAYFQEEGLKLLREKRN